MTVFLKLIPLSWKIGAVLALLGGLWGAYAWIRADAYHDGFAAAEAVCVEQKAEQAEANRNAATRAFKQLESAAVKLHELDKELADAQEKLDAAANADPDANACGIGVDSVRRLNAVR